MCTTLSFLVNYKYIPLLHHCMFYNVAQSLNSKLGCSFLTFVGGIIDPWSELPSSEYYPEYDHPIFGRFEVGPEFFVFLLVKKVDIQFADVGSCVNKEVSLCKWKEGGCTWRATLDTGVHKGTGSVTHLLTPTVVERSSRGCHYWLGGI